MKILYLVADGPHAHDYGADNLYAGFCTILGYQNVLDVPEKGALHDGRDECEIDSDQGRDRKGHTMEEAVDQATIAFIAMHPGGDAQLARDACKRLPVSVPIAALDFSDQLGSCREWYENVAGRRVVAYFKRELPLNEHWAIPCPLSYPGNRSPEKLPQKNWQKVFYHATDHGGGSPGIPRRVFVERLREIVDEKHLDVNLYPGQARGTRPDPDDYHKKMLNAGIGFAWNGAPNFDNNRIWENFAFGLANVLERPRIQIPNMPQDQQHCYYVDSPIAGANTVQQLVKNHILAKQIGMAGHEWFRRFHTSEARATYVLEHVREGLKEKVEPVSSTAKFADDWQAWTKTLPRWEDQEFPKETLMAGKVEDEDQADSVKPRVTDTKRGKTTKKRKGQAV